MIVPLFHWDNEKGVLLLENAPLRGKNVNCRCSNLTEIFLNMVFSLCSYSLRVEQTAMKPWQKRGGSLRFRVFNLCEWLFGSAGVRHAGACCTYMLDTLCHVYIRYNRHVMWCVWHMGTVCPMCSQIGHQDSSPFT